VYSKDETPESLLLYVHAYIKIHFAMQAFSETCGDHNKFSLMFSTYSPLNSEARFHPEGGSKVL
jgi:hypothetical protein